MSGNGPTLPVGGGFTIPYRIDLESEAYLARIGAGLRRQIPTASISSGGVDQRRREPIEGWQLVALLSTGRDEQDFARYSRGQRSRRMIELTAIEIDRPAQRSRPAQGEAPGPTRGGYSRSEQAYEAAAQFEERARDYSKYCGSRRR
jgi:hypothetical protein